LAAVPAPAHTNPERPMLLKRTSFDLRHHRQLQEACDENVLLVLVRTADAAL
jgi:hypothetical protein